MKKTNRHKGGHTEGELGPKQKTGPRVVIDDGEPTFEIQKDRVMAPTHKKTAWKMVGR